MAGTDQDDFSRSVVAASSLRPWWYLLVIELGVLLSIPLFVIGGQLGFGLTIGQLVTATLLGGAILGLIGALTARLGARTRCSTALLARATFGTRGAACIAFLLAFGMTGWWAVQLELFTGAVSGLVQKLFSIGVSREITIAVSGLAMITTAALGIRAIGRLAYLAVPMLVGGLCYAFSTLLAQNGLHTASHYAPAAKIAIPFGSAVATVVGGWILGAAMNPDYARFAKTEKHAVAYALGHYSFNYPVLLIVCGTMAIGFQSQDLMSHLVPPNLSWLLLVFMMLATWAANDCNLYSSSLGLTAVVPRLKRSHLAIAAGVVGIVMAEMNLAAHMVSFLVLLGIFIAPISGVFIVGAVDPRNEQGELSAPPKWRWRPILAWFGGALVGYLCTPAKDLGLGLLQATTIPTLDSVIAASLIMFVLRTKTAPVEHSRPAGNLLPVETVGVAAYGHSSSHR